MGHARKQLISIYVVAKCNLRCKYCALSAGDMEVLPEYQVIDMGFVKRGIIDFLGIIPVEVLDFMVQGNLLWKCLL